MKTKILDINFEMNYFEIKPIFNHNLIEINKIFFDKKVNKDLQIGDEIEVTFFDGLVPKIIPKVITQEDSVFDVNHNEIWFHSTIVPVKNEMDEVDSVMVVSIDTTKIKH